MFPTFFYFIINQNKRGLVDEITTAQIATIQNSLTACHFYTLFSQLPKSDKLFFGQS
jgi:hypothetical protein